MRIEVDYRDPVAAHEFSQTPPPAGVEIEPFSVAMSNEPGFVFPSVVTVVLAFGVDVSARVVAHFLIEAITHHKDKDKHKEQQIRIEGFKVECQEDAIRRRIEELR